MRVFVKGYYSTKFGELWDKSLSDLIEEAIFGVLKSANLEVKDISAIFVGNMLSGMLDENLLLSAKINEILGNPGLPIFRFEAACASGGTAFYNAVQFLKAEKGKNVLVLGLEKMTDFCTEDVTTALASALSGEEQVAGLTFPGAYALMARYYLEKYGYSEENLAYVSVKNHFFGSLNPKAHFRKKITLEDVLNSAYIAEPLKVLDCSPISDGASALILSTEKSLVEVASCEVATDTISLVRRKNLDEMLSVKRSGERAFSFAGVEAKDVDVAEVHDCFSIAEILVIESLGFWKKGEGGERMKEFDLEDPFKSKPVVNTSGGLKAAGHPVGATGIKQIGEIFLQLSGRAEKRQVEGAKLGLAQNTAGSGGLSVVTILKR